MKDQTRSDSLFLRNIAPSPFVCEAARAGHGLINRVLEMKAKLCLVPVRLLLFPAVCGFGAWVQLVSVTSPRRTEFIPVTLPRSIWELMTAHTEREREA